MAVPYKEFGSEISAPDRRIIGLAAPRAIVFVRVLVGSAIQRCVDVPAEGFEEWVEEFARNLGFVVLAGFVGVEVALEAFDEIENFFWGGHDDVGRLEVISLVGKRGLGPPFLIFP